MFRTAATKIAHNSTLPALAGNRDLKPLQELITAEKSVLQSLQRLSNDLSKSNDCLRHWGAGEGDDLQDVLTASTVLLGHLSSAFLQLANHEVSIREHLKAVRTREENLDELRRRRKAVSAKADTAEKRLSKMSPEHKSLQQQTELLNNLRDQIRNLDYEILSEEARLGDFKRSSAKNWMMLKFGGLLECAEKSTIVAEMGKLVIEEIPLGTTQPGQLRSFYSGHEKTEKLVAEAQRCIAEIVFDPQPISPSVAGKSSGLDGNRSSIDGLPGGGNLDSSAYFQGPNATSGSGFGAGPNVDEFGGLGDPHDSRGYGTMPSPMPGGPIRIGDDGSRLSSAIGEGSSSNVGSTFTPPISPPGSRFGSGGGQFATFPTRKSSLPGPGLGSPPMQANQNLSLQPLDEGQGLTSDFAAEIADALAYAERDGQHRAVQGKISLDGPAPSYQTHDAHGWNMPVTSSGLPRGAAPPTVEHNLWGGVAHAPPPPPHHTGHISVTGSSPPQSRPSQHLRESETTENDDETQLPYASPPPVEHQLPPVPGEQSSRHVHFGGDQSVHETNGHGQAPDAPTTQERIPSPPPFNDADASAAAAREVAREMDMLTFSPPPGPPPGHAEHRTPSPLLPPAPPFAQQRMSPSPEYGATLTPRSEGMFSSSKTDIRGSSPVPNDGVPIPQATSSSPPSPGVTHQTRPSMSINVHSPSPAYSFNSATASTYSTPPEMPAIQPLRTGSPASPSILTPGARTISAAAFKRPALRSATGVQSSDTRPLPDVTPLSLRKKSGGGPGLPSSPYGGSREALPSPQQGQGPRQDPHVRPSDESLREPPDYESTYDVVSSYGEPTGSASHEAHANDENASSPGYGSGKFATNLDNEGLR